MSRSIHTATLEEAIIYATRQHEGTTRKQSTIPYILHPLEALQLLTEMEADLNLMMAGVLHDTVEDTDATCDDIRERFGEDVAQLVCAHTEDKSKTWKERKSHTIEELATADVRMKKLVLADKLANLRSMDRDYQKVGEHLWDRFNAPRESQAWYYHGIMDGLQELKERPETAAIYQEMVDLYQKLF